MAITAKVTSKGQITIPSRLRKRLDSRIVELEEQDGAVIIRPVRSVAGALSKYAGKGEEKSFSEIREEAWSEVMREKRLAPRR